MKITIGTIGSHSAEEIAVSAKSNSLNTIIFCQKGREKYYTHYIKHLFDEIIILDKFTDILHEEHQNRLREMNTIIIPNRSLVVYLGYFGIESQLLIPIYGNRNILRIEDRNYERNQYWLMKKANMRLPIQYSHKKIPKLAIVKVQQKNNPLERAFFYVSSEEELQQKSEELISKGVIDEEEFEQCIIEEFVLGPRFNANFHAYALNDLYDRFDFVGFDDRVQTNLQGILNLPAKDQLKLSVPLKNEEVGHRPLSMRESKKILVYDAAEAFLDVVEKEFPPKMIGMFALQGAVNEFNEFVVFDISPRVPGSPILGSTSPEMRRLGLKFKHKIQSPLDLTMIEIKQAIKENRIEEITT